MNIKIHLYVWDSSNWFDYYRHKDLYDSIHTFDMSDADKYEKAEYLPFLYLVKCKITKPTNLNIK